MKKLTLGLILCVGLFQAIPLMAVEQTTWGEAKNSSIFEEPAGKLVVTKNKVGGTAERGKPRLKITAVSPPHLLSAGNGVVVDEFEVGVVGGVVMWFGFPIHIPQGLTNVRMYYSNWGDLQIGPTFAGSGDYWIPWRMNLKDGQDAVRIEFRADVINSDGTLPEEGTHLSIDFLAGGDAIESTSRVVSTPAVQGIGGDVFYPPVLDCAGRSECGE